MKNSFPDIEVIPVPSEHCKIRFRLPEMATGGMKDRVNSLELLDAYLESPRLAGVWAWEWQPVLRSLEDEPSVCVEHARFPRSTWKALARAVRELDAKPGALLAGFFSRSIPLPVTLRIPESILGEFEAYTADDADWDRGGLFGKGLSADLLASILVGVAGVERGSKSFNRPSGYAVRSPKHRLARLRKLSEKEPVREVKIRPRTACRESIQAAAGRLGISAEDFCAVSIDYHAALYRKEHAEPENPANRFE